MPEGRTPQAAPARVAVEESSFAKASERLLRSSKSEAEAKLLQLIVFRLGDEEFGAEIGEVREIIKTGTITPIPDSPDFIRGVTNVRGDIVATIDLKSRLSLPGTTPVPSKHIIITQQQESLFGLMVDEVAEVLRIPETEIKPPPEIVTRIHEDYVRGVVTVGNRLIILLDLAKVLSEEDLMTLTDVQRRQRERGASTARRVVEQGRPLDAGPSLGQGALAPRPATSESRGGRGRPERAKRVEGRHTEEAAAEAQTPLVVEKKKKRSRN